MRGRSQKTNLQRSITGSGKVKNIPRPKKARRMLCPDWMPTPGRKLWRKIVPELQRLGVLCEIDRSNLEMLCRAFAMMDQAAREIETLGGSLPDGRGGFKKNPSFTIYSKNQEIFKRMSDAFGLNPQARQRLDVEPPPPADDPSSEFF